MDGAPSNREDPAEEEFEFTFAGGAVLKFEDGDDEGEQDGDVHMLSSQLSSGSRGVTHRITDPDEDEEEDEREDQDKEEPPAAPALTAAQQQPAAPAAAAVVTMAIDLVVKY